MGFIIDIILVAILLLSTFLGYKKGLVKLGAKLFAGIIAIIVTIVAYRPVSGMIINNTSIDEKIEEAIVQNATNYIDEKSEGSNVVTDSIENQILPEQAKNIAQGVVYAVTAIVLFIVVKIVLGIIVSLLDFVANLPILKQFNEIGGILYGIVRGILIVGIIILLMGVFTKINPESDLNEKIQSSFLTKTIYENIVKF
ncbi:MAG: CvpA family protein [Clostridia bacterium]|jgi:uncharacterized membrane protein required for colicin V production|nr:CvpA family protein [Clostridia bacterium]